jgi:hypothetical protein
VSNHNKYKIYRNIFNSVKRKAKKLHYSNELLANSNNLRKTWSLLNEVLMKSKSKQPINSIFYDNVFISNPATIANTFNKFFTTIADEIANLINPVPDCDIDLPTNNLAGDPNIVPRFNLTEIPLSEGEVLECIASLEDKKTPDMMGFSTNLLKKVSHSILKPITHIFGCSLTTGVVPSKLKIAKVIPIFKSGDASDINNYRPISLLSSFSKILEKIVQNRLVKYLDLFNLITPQQFGFRSGHSTTHPMTLLLNKVTDALNKKKHSIILFCDLKKAFDTCNHQILLKKLKNLGVTGTELDWFKNYLTDRKQFVCIDNCTSDLLSILTGVPQGSILGPLLFLIYINDLPDCNRLFSLLFADDTALTYSANNLDELFDVTNSELKKLCTYFRANKLSLHPDKTKYLVITYNNVTLSETHTIHINNNNTGENDPNRIFKLHRISDIDSVPAIKYLGVYFDENLNFKYHVNYISKKLSSALFSLRSVRNLLPPNALKTLYYSLFHCHLVYAIEIWSSCSPSTLQPLISKQKAAIRIISSKKYNDHTEPLFKELNILPLPDLITLFNLKLFHSFVHKYIPIAFENSWWTVRNQRDGVADIELRNDDDYYIPRHRTEQILRFPLFNLPITWNLLHTELTDSSTKRTFVKSASHYFLSKLSSIPNCNRLLCPSCLTNNLNQQNN